MIELDARFIDMPFIAGHRNDSICDSICSVLERSQSVLASLPWALITSVDSYLDLHTILESRVLCSRFGSVFLENALLLPGAELVRAAQELRLFSGFDEVWWFSHRPIMPKPDIVFITGPEDLSNGVSKDVSEWFMAAHCLLGLGDGIGLNYITNRQDLYLAVVG